MANQTADRAYGLKVAVAESVSVWPGGTMFKMARYPSGKGEVCKTFMRRFDSDPRLQHFSVQVHLIQQVSKEIAFVLVRSQSGRIGLNWPQKRTKSGRRKIPLTG